MRKVINNVGLKKVNIDGENRDLSGNIIFSPGMDYTMGLYPKKCMYKHHITHGQINFFDTLITTERQINGGEYWVYPDDVSKVHADDIAEGSIVDKDDVLGLFSIYGLVEGDILELHKFVINDYIKKGSAESGYHIQCFKGYKGTNQVIPGLYFRFGVDSSGADDYDLLWRMYYYE